MLLSENNPRQSFLGLVPGNRLARWAQISLIVSILLTLLTLSEALFAPTLSRRYAGGTAFLFTASLSPIVVGLLILYSRRVVRSIELREGGYWAKWIYNTRLPSDDLSTSAQQEIYISPTGVYRTDQRIKFREFSGGIEQAEIIPGGRPMLRLVYRHIQNKRRYQIPQEELIPIPPGYQAEAEKLVERFQKEGLHRVSRWLFDLWIGVLGITGMFSLGCIIAMMLLLPLDEQRQDEQRAQYSATSAAIQATETHLISLDFPRIRQVILDQTEMLRPQGNGQLSATEAGFASGDNVQQVEFGYCGRDENFYVLVLLKKPLFDTVLSDIGAYLYTDAVNPYACSGVWEIISMDSLEGNWHYLSLSSNRATLVPYLTENAEYFNSILTGTPPPTP
ncbi:MAG: hypothetical protein K8L97_02130 [Anaerolineae bacterium]|nr:hypothetical protein [Anaerolineae bacterium]